MTDPREAQALRREAARKALCQILNPDSAVLRNIIDDLFPLPAEEPETVEAFGWLWRMADGQLEYFHIPDQGWRNFVPNPDDYLAMADLIRRHRDRAWVADHEERGEFEDPHSGFLRWHFTSGGTLQPRDVDTHLDVPIPITPQRAEFLRCILNGSRKAP